MRILLVSAVSLLVTTGVSSAADPDIMSGMHGGDFAINSELPPDHPVGTKATVAFVSFKRALHLDKPFLSTFIVDYLPGGSAVLHRAPTAGYVLVHVLSGTIRAQAWARIVPVKLGSSRPSPTTSPPKMPALLNRRVRLSS